MFFPILPTYYCMDSAKLRFLPIVVMSILAITEMATDIYIPSLPSLVDIFQTSEHTLSLTLSICLFGFGLGALLMGPLSDSFGRKPVMTGGLVIFFLGSLFSGLSESVYSLITARFIQGLGLSVGYVVGVAMLKDVYHGKRFAKIMSTVHVVVAMAPAIAPILGSYIDLVYGWSMNFFIVAGLSLLAIAMMLYQSDTHGQEQRTPLSLADTLTGYKTMLQSRRFMGYAMISSVIYAGLWMYFSIVPHIFHEFGLPKTYYGYFQAVMVVVYMMGTILNGMLIDRMGVDRLLSISLYITFTASILSAVLAFLYPSSTMGMAVGMAVFCFGLGGVFANASTRTMEVFPEMKGKASSMLTFLECTVPSLGVYVISIVYDDTILTLSYGLILVSIITLSINILAKAKKAVVVS